MLSVLIPTYDCDIVPLAREIHRQLTQAGLPFEIIVADDSPQSPHRVINREVTGLAHSLMLENPTNMGRTLTRQKLAQTAAFQTLLFLDADVMPGDDDFISRYLPFLGHKAVVLGGYAYLPHPENKSLRWQYGLAREQKPAEERARRPYERIFSGNLLIDRALFLQHNFSQSENWYGMDIYFSYRLFLNKVQIIHIDNPIFHLGLEPDAVFFEKCLASVRSRKMLLANAEGIENVNALLRHFKRLKKWRLDGLAAFFFRLSEPLLKQMVLKKDHNLFCLDLYRLGYICNLP